MAENRSAARTSKLADKFGITKRSDFNALQNFVENPNENPAVFLKGHRNKMSKLQAKLGEEELAQYKVSNEGSDRGELMNIHKLKKNTKHASISDDLLCKAELVGTNSPRVKTSNESIGSGSRASSRENSETQLAVSKDHFTDSLRTSFEEFKILDTCSGSVASLGSLRNNARVGKLVDFFGAKEDHVGALRRIVRNTKETQPNSKRNNVLTFMLRLHFVNATHIIVAMPIEATASQIVEHALRKLMIHDDTALYGIYLLNSTEPSEVKEEIPRPVVTVLRMLTDTERVYDVVRTWKDGDYLLFRRRGREEMSVEPMETECTTEIEELTGTEEDDTDAYQKRRVTKLATFFGVKPENEQSMTEGQAELEDLLHMVAESGALASQQNLANLPTGPVEHGQIGSELSLRRQTMTQTMIVKEGWLTIIDPATTKESITWVSLEQGKMHVKHCESKQSQKQTQPIHTLVLEDVQCTVRGDVEFILKSNLSEETLYEFTAPSTTDRDDWVMSIDKYKLNLNNSNASKQGGDKLSRLSRTGIEDFEFHRVLGKGKYGKVLLCSNKQSKKVFAIKIIHNDDESVQTAKIESEILRSIKHPFIVGLHFAFQSVERLYLVMEYVNGGELFFHLSQSGRFTEKRAKFYGAEIILGLQCLHGKGIVYRDLKLENVLLDKDGHIKIADFGLSSYSTDEAKDQTFSMAGTIEYFAPEVIERVNYSYPADWWAFGVILFELVCGYHPFYNSNPSILNELILHAPLEFPSYISFKCVDLISRLLDRNYKTRLGSGKLGTREIQNHTFFKEIDFAKLFRKEIVPPWLPDLKDEFDVKFFDKEFTSEAILDEDVK